MRALTVALFFLSLTSIAQTTCLDPLACNFTEIGDCVYLDIDGLPCVSEGCAIPGACNFDPEADINDGSCEFTSCLGCTDETACNYEPEALYLDLSCIYFVDCNGVCGGDWIEDECGNCFQSYSESIYTFETCGAEGRFGPSQEQCDQVYGSEFVTCVEGIQTWVVPESGTYRIEVFGAEGGYNDRFCGDDIFNTLDRALGARINANIDLEAGQIVWIVIGQQGVTADADGCNGGSGGGGGSFVFTEYDLLLVAGGGGGSGLRNQYSQQTQSGKPGVTSNNGTSSWSGAAGGTVGYNGAGDGGSGGQGWNTLSYTYIFDGFFVDNSYHGHGGFGGGGGGYGHHGAGGGGYSGGGGSNFTYAGGGGGGSYISEDGTLISAESGVNEGHGMVVIEFSSPSDPECQLGCIVEQACNFNPEATNDDGTCDFCFCGPGTAWDNLSEQCLIVNGSSDIDGDGCTNLSDLLDLLSDYGICLEPEFTACGDLINHEGYDYSTVQIGDQCWFSENCRYLPVVLPSSEGSETSPFYYVWGYEGTDLAEAKATTNYFTYGVLYNWPAVMSEGVCPSGWHIPSDGEFTELTDFLGGEEVAGGKMKDDVFWNGSNSSGFTGLAGGNRRPNGNFNDFNYGFFWSSSFYSGSSGSFGFIRSLNSYSTAVGRNAYNLSYGLSARCIKD